MLICHEETVFAAELVAFVKHMDSFETVNTKEKLMMICS
jgi:hypothetical protein